MQIAPPLNRPLLSRRPETQHCRRCRALLPSSPPSTGPCCWTRPETCGHIEDNPFATPSWRPQDRRHGVIATTSIREPPSSSTGFRCRRRPAFQVGVQPECVCFCVMHVCQLFGPRSGVCLCDFQGAWSRADFACTRSTCVCTLPDVRFLFVVRARVSQLCVCVCVCLCVCVCVEIIFLSSCRVCCRGARDHLSSCLNCVPPQHLACQFAVGPNLCVGCSYVSGRRHNSSTMSQSELEGHDWSEGESTRGAPLSEDDHMFEEFQRQELQRRNKFTARIRKVLVTSGVNKVHLQDAFQGVMEVCCDALRDNDTAFFYVNAGRELGPEDTACRPDDVDRNIEHQ